MNTQNNIAILYKTISDLAKKGDEEALRSFLIEHLTEFPEDTQKKIVFEFFNEALDNKIDDETQKIEIQKKGMDLLKEIGEVEKTLDTHKKITNIRLDLTQ